MAQINKPSDYFNTVTYTGNGSTHSITGVGHQPDWLWIKCRNFANGHALFDVQRTTYSLSTENTGAEVDRSSDGFTSLDSDGFTLNGSGSGGRVNVSGRTYASWNWLASNTTASNTDGSITSTVSANTTSGFSIVSYTGNATSGATVGHGLGVAPKMIIVKTRAQTNNWTVYHESIGATKHLHLNTTDQESTATNTFNDTAPTSSVFTLGSGTETNASGNMIAYCFAEKKGFSKFGKYVGNNNDDGTFVYTGSKPAFLLIKIIDTQTDNWIMQDNKINTFNSATSQRLRANSSGAEFSSSNEIDLLSNGFKVHGADGEINGSGASYIYMAFAENPLVGTNNIPATAR